MDADLDKYMGRGHRLWSAALPVEVAVAISGGLYSLAVRSLEARSPQPPESRRSADFVKVTKKGQRKRSRPKKRPATSQECLNDSGQSDWKGIYRHLDSEAPVGEGIWAGF